jgi:hypothetical protein
MGKSEEVGDNFMGHFLLSEVKMPGKYSLFFALSEAQPQ